MRTALSTVNLVVGGIVLLGLALLALAGIIAVNDTPSAVPEALWTVIGGVVGALAAMLARTSTDPPAVAVGEQATLPATLDTSAPTMPASYEAAHENPQPEDPTVR